MKVTNLIDRPHHITVTAAVIQKFNYILNSKYDLEFTAFCHAEKRVNSEYHIFDIFFPRQDNDKTGTECTSEDIMALEAEGADITMLTGHIHSHVNMNVFTSTTDVKDIIERAEICGYNASLIMNKKGEIFGHIVDMELGIHVEKCPVLIHYPFTEEKYESDVIERIKLCDNLEDIRTLTRFTMSDYFDVMYPLTEEQVFNLQETVKNKFEKKIVVSKNKNYAGNTTRSVQLSLPPVEDVVELDEPVSNNPYDFFTPEEMAIIFEANKKPIAAMTDMEFRLIQEYDVYFGNRNWMDHE